MSKNRKFTDSRLRESTEIPEEPTSYWLENFEDWLRRVAIDLEGRPSPVLRTLRQQVMTRLGEVAFLKEREIKREKKVARSYQPEPVEGEASDLGNVHARLDLLARCSGDQNERLIKAEQYLSTLGVELNDRIGTIRRAFDEHDERLLKVEQRLSVLDDIDAGLDERIDTVSKRLDALEKEKQDWRTISRSLGAQINLLECRVNALEEEKQKHCKEQENIENAFDRRIFHLEHEPRKREEKIGMLEEKMNALHRALDELQTGLGEIMHGAMKRINAQEEQIDRLQNVLQAIAEALSKEYE